MVAKQGLRAKENIQKALTEFVDGGEHVIVFENEWGHMGVFLGSEKFRGKNPLARIDIVWDFLRNRLEWEDLSRLSTIHAWTPEEYDQWAPRAQ